MADPFLVWGCCVCSSCPLCGVCGLSQPHRDHLSRGSFLLPRAWGPAVADVLPTEPGPWAQGQAPLSVSLGTSLIPGASSLYPFHPHPYSPTTRPSPRSLCSSSSVYMTDWTQTGPIPVYFLSGIVMLVSLIFASLTHLCWFSCVLCIKALTSCFPRRFMHCPHTSHVALQRMCFLCSSPRR